MYLCTYKQDECRAWFFVSETLRVGRSRGVERPCGSSRGGHVSPFSFAEKITYYRKTTLTCMSPTAEEIILRHSSIHLMS